ncbi:MAG: hypothetical protein JWM12_737, partial [Ilumatobacteraceae bacterium]|nr:hypothetical protein [Ilumatobacteraceae bacterium]
MRLSPDDFMWMGRVQAASGVALELNRRKSRAGTIAAQLG